MLAEPKFDCGHETPSEHHRGACAWLHLALKCLPRSPLSLSRPCCHRCTSCSPRLKLLTLKYSTCLQNFARADRNPAISSLVRRSLPRYIWSQAAVGQILCPCTAWMPGGERAHSQHCGGSRAWYCADLRAQQKCGSGRRICEGGQMGAHQVCGCLHCGKNPGHHGFWQGKGIYDTDVKHTFKEAKPKARPLPFEVACMRVLRMFCVF